MSWNHLIVLLQAELQEVIETEPEAREWSVLLEFPLYRLQKRLDVVVLTGAAIVVLEAKVGEQFFRAHDRRQVEEYALDLRDFHAGSRNESLIPVLWCTEADQQPFNYAPMPGQVAEVQCVGRNGLASLLLHIGAVTSKSRHIVAEVWDSSDYRPVPNVIQAATSIFAGHGVKTILRADASNVKDASIRIVQLIKEAKTNRARYLLFLTGVPGSGKTLAGLHVVHDAVASGAENQGDIVYLSGNTPLVTVLREALARDEFLRARSSTNRATLNDIRRSMRARIQHINDFLKQHLLSSNNTPHEHALVFDEAQRAWDEAQGKLKFQRTASEPTLLLEVMGRHSDWCALVCLVGGGQEINSGEQGIRGWGLALRTLDPSVAVKWAVYGSEDVFRGGSSTGGLSLGELPAQIRAVIQPELELNVPLRSYRAPELSEWVSLVLEGRAEEAAARSQLLPQYPIRLTRSLQSARDWLSQSARGERRYGLLASSGARRLRADGLGVLLHAADGIDIAHWYLNELGDIRSSFALEVPANEFTCQGLELDFAGLCWGGDFVRDLAQDKWMTRRLNGSRWQAANTTDRRRFIQNAYRVLLTRAREGMIIWVPVGASSDITREPDALDATAEFLMACGAAPL